MAVLFRLPDLFPVGLFWSWLDLAWSWLGLGDRAMVRMITEGGAECQITHSDAGSRESRVEMEGP